MDTRNNEYVTVSSRKRKKGKNELRVLKAVTPSMYYNDYVTPLNPKKFTPMTDDRPLSLCPLHTDTDPSLHFWKAKGVFNCFGCGAGGDVVHFNILLQKKYHNKNLSPDDSVRQLSAFYKLKYEDEPEEEDNQTVFSRARSLLNSPSSIAVPSDRYSLANYRTMNNRVIRATGMTLESKAKNFAQLDLIASCAVINEGEI